MEEYAKFILLNKTHICAKFDRKLRKREELVCQVQANVLGGF